MPKESTPSVYIGMGKIYSFCPFHWDIGEQERSWHFLLHLGRRFVFRQTPERKLVDKGLFAWCYCSMNFPGSVSSLSGRMNLDECHRHISKPQKTDRLVDQNKEPCPTSCSETWTSFRRDQTSWKSNKGWPGFLSPVEAEGWTNRQVQTRPLPFSAPMVLRDQLSFLLWPIWFNPPTKHP